MIARRREYNHCLKGLELYSPSDKAESRRQNSTALQTVSRQQCTCPDLTVKTSHVVFSLKRCRQAGRHLGRDLSINTTVTTIHSTPFELVTRITLEGRISNSRSPGGCYLNPRPSHHTRTKLFPMKQCTKIRVCHIEQGLWRHISKPLTSSLYTC